MRTRGRTSITLRLTIVLTVIAVLPLLVGCGQQATSRIQARPHPGVTSSAATASAPATEYVTLSPFKARLPRETVAEICASSDVVVRGRVTDVRYVVANGLPHTVFKVRVVKSWTSGVSKGEMITITRDGGVWSEADSMRNSGKPLTQAPTAQQEVREIAVLLDGQPLPAVGDQALYMLTADDQGWGKILGVEGTLYTYDPLDSEFSLKDGSYERFTPAGYKADKIGRKAAKELEASVSTAMNRSPSE